MRSVTISQFKAGKLLLYSPALAMPGLCSMVCMSNDSTYTLHKVSHNL